MMSAILDRDKLAKVLGVLGSAHAGEIAAAGRTAHLLIREAGTTWQEVLDNSALSPGLRVVPNNEALLRAKLRAVNVKLRHEIELLRALEKSPPEWRQPADEDEQIKLCVNWRAYLDDCEREFVISLLGNRRLGRNQAARLWEIVLKTRTIARRIGGIAAA